MGLKVGERRYNADKNEWEMKPVKPVAKPAGMGKKPKASAPTPQARPKATAAAVSGKSGVPTNKGFAAKGTAAALTKPSAPKSSAPVPKTMPAGLRGKKVVDPKAMGMNTKKVDVKAMYGSRSKP